MSNDVVVVLSFHGRADTERCVESLVAGSPDTCIMVIDNGSFDGVLDSVRERWPLVHALQTGRNLGFSGGMNIGLRWALDAGAATVTVLNNDTVLPQGAISRLAAVAREGVAVSPEVHYADGSGRVWFGGGLVDCDTGLARHLAEAELATQPVNEAGLRRTDMLAGCCVTATREIWQKVGLFDDAYFLIFEDSDWSARAAAVGVPLVVDTHTVIKHRVSATFTGAANYLGLYYYTRNGLRFGRTRCEPSRLRSARFLRRHVLPHVVGPARRREWRQARRLAVVVAAAVADAVRRRSGEAPPLLQQRARAWAAK